MAIFKMRYKRSIGLVIFLYSFGCYANICDDIRVTRDLIKTGESRLADGNYTDAIALFDRGIEQIGDRYLSDDLCDDTTTKLMLSQFVQQEGKLSQAAHLRLGVLSSRLVLLEEGNPSCQSAH